MESVKISILLPTYNQCNLLKKSIKSVIKQTFKNWELIVIDNKSIDGTKKFVKKISKTDKRIKYFSISNKGILAKSRNLGIRKSKGQWIAFIDSDDIWHKDKLLKCYNCASETNADFIYHPVFSINEIVNSKKIISDKNRVIQQPIYKDLILNGNSIAQSSAMVKKKILKKIGGISENFEVYSWEDFDTWIRCSLVTDNFVQVPIPLAECWTGRGTLSNLEQTQINYKNFGKRYRSIIKRINKKDYKDLWWIEYTSALNSFKNKDYEKIQINKLYLKEGPWRLKIRFLYIKIYSIIKLAVRFLKLFFIKIEIYANTKKKAKIINKKNFYIIKNMDQLKKIDLSIPYQIKKNIERLNKKNYLALLIKNKKIICSGWISYEIFFNIIEIRKNIRLKKNIMLYDFNTPQKFQNKGYYKMLLNILSSINIKNKNKYIFVDKKNLYSRKAIESSNFKFFKSLSYFKKIYEI